MSEGRVKLPGQQLRAERESRGMSEEEVSRELNLTTSFLRALEADDYERLPEATFIRGYIRNYARLLGVSSDELTHTFDQVMEEEAADDREQFQTDVVRPRRRRSWRLALSALVVVLAAALLYLLFAGTGESPGNDAGNEGQPAPSGMDAGSTSLSAPATTVAGSDALAGEEPGAAGEGQTSGQEPVVDQTAQEAAAVEGAVPDNLVVSFRESCWVEVTNEAGEILFAGQKQADERLSLEAVGPFRIKFGNAAAVSLITVNGDVVSMPSSAPGNVVRLTVP